VPSSGKQHTSGHAKAAMGRLLDDLGGKAPALVRGDCGYGNEDVIDVCEQRDLIDHVAARLGRNKSDFMLKAARDRMPSVFFDQVFFGLDACRTCSHRDR
jgi:hypothetical protein